MDHNYKCVSICGDRAPVVDHNYKCVSICGDRAQQWTIIINVLIFVVIELQ